MHPGHPQQKPSSPNRKREFRCKSAWSCISLKLAISFSFLFFFLSLFSLQKKPKARKQLSQRGEKNAEEKANFRAGRKYILLKARWDSSLAGFEMRPPTAPPLAAPTRWDGSQSSIPHVDTPSIPVLLTSPPPRPDLWPLHACCDDAHLSVELWPFPIVWKDSFSCSDACAIKSGLFFFFFKLVLHTLKQTKHGS